MMSKCDFVALADAIRIHNQVAKHTGFKPFTREQIIALADFCKAQNGNFMRERWLEYTAGNCGKNGGSLKKAGK